MQVCPTCMEPLLRKTTPRGVVHVCGKCGGRSVSAPVLAKTANADFVRRLRRGPAHSSTERGKSCPTCLREMLKVDFGSQGAPVLVDVCKYCRLVWFDPGEYEQAVTDTVRQELRRREPTAPGEDKEVFDVAWRLVGWRTLPAVLGMPIECDPDRLRDRPLVTRALTALMAVLFVFLVLTGRLEGAILKWGLIPSLWSRHGGLTLATSFFLHAGWWHLIGNAYFFWVFGDNVEDDLGRLRFVLLLVGAHLGGMVLYTAVTHYPHIPCVGASAGISGVIAYYAVVFPRARIGICRWWLLFRILRIPAWTGLLLYIVIQIVGLYAARLGAGAPVAYAAHLGGLAVGALAGAVALARAERRKK